MMKELQYKAEGIRIGLAVGLWWRSSGGGFGYGGVKRGGELISGKALVLVVATVRQITTVEQCDESVGQASMITVLEYHAISCFLRPPRGLYWYRFDAWILFHIMVAVTICI